MYGYGLHLTVNHAGFPVLIDVETAACSEKAALARKETVLLYQLRPETLSGDNAYTAAKRIRAWARQGVALPTPARRWRNGRYAAAYHHFLTQPDIAPLLRQRKTVIEPIFDLVAKLLGATRNHKQLALQHLPQCPYLYRLGRLLSSTCHDRQRHLELTFSLDFDHSRGVCMIYAHPLR